MRLGFVAMGGIMVMMSLAAVADSVMVVSFENAYEKDLCLYYDPFMVNGQTAYTFLEEISPGHSVEMRSYPSHRFELRACESQRVVDLVQVVEGVYNYVINGFPICENGDESPGADFDPTLLQCTDAKPIAHTSFHANVVVPNREMRVVEADRHDVNLRKHCNVRREWLNKNQPKITPTFSEFTGPGYKKIKVPKRAWDTVKKFWDNNRHRAVEEVRPKDECHINYWEAPVYVTFPPEYVLKTLRDDVRPVLEDWIGGRKLHWTATYGIRVYTNNSWLENHVDRSATHAISAIIQVDQHVEEDWELEVHGHDGKVVRMPMEPGDMVLYESASVIHGRR
eukprot:CAMPEP_0119151396 /NCGR_PEP_ID=MMETSP1310-20130426/46261_1 /TAXON_ID=464262 /ORGANISM="Genus nov. species nov., Strain RCC2339" /LENGTH=337 /DNA_ID=CAMNT_0007143665 /DNA_START=63 /DNA_END=1073 /DNA_ORIENTATION=-